ncbi:MAG: ATP-binding protein [Oscillospiraceae bacterium]|nr:ATP-binding protein [Oscillospiraceae bacterium]
MVEQNATNPDAESRDLLELLRRVTNISSIGIHVVDIHTMEMYYCNDAGFRLISQEPCEYHGRPCYETFFGIDHPCTNCRLEQTKRGETRHDVYVPAVGKTFRTHTQITTWNGKSAFVEYITDVTKTKQLEQKQKHLLAQLETNTSELRRKYEVEKRRSRDDKSILAYAVFNLKNQQTVEMERRPPLVLLQSPLALEAFRLDIASSILRNDQRETFLHMFDVGELVRLYQGGVEEQHLEFQRILPGGKVIWVHSSFHIMPEPDGQDLLLFYYCNDINLRKSLEILSTYIANEDYDMIGCINFHDDSAIMMYGKTSSYVIHVGERSYQEERYSEALEWFVSTAVVPEERELYRPQFFIEKIKAELFATGTYEFRLHVAGKNGERLTKKIRYTQYDKESEVCLFTQTDITALLAEEEQKQQQLKAALLEAQTADAAKSEFLARMSHDIRTPLNVIIGMSHLAADNENPADTNDCLRKINISGDFLLGLINDVLDMERISSGKMQLELSPYSGEEFAQYINAVITPQCQEKGISFDYSYNGSNDFVVLQDKLRINQIYFNLLSNAVKYTPKGGKITFYTEITRTGKTVILDVTISDTGIGMSQAFQAHMFEPFTQENQAVTPIGTGTGLGLSIVKNLCDMMNMRISVESALGKGTTFYIHGEYDVAADLSAAARPDHLRETPELAFNRQKILVCEDHPMNQEIIKRLLEKKGATVVIAENGWSGVEAFRQSPQYHYTAILMDIHMPVMDGLQAARTIRALPRADAMNVPIIALSANAYEEDIRQSRMAGMNAHLSKPIDPLLLYKCLAKHLAASKGANAGEHR